MKQITLLTVGRIKTPYWHEAIQYYHKRLASSIRITAHHVKDADPALPMEKRLLQESEALQKRIQPNDFLVCLDDKGKTQSSPLFASWLNNLWDENKNPVFIIGGAFGLAPELKNRANILFSFGPMTLTHELAQVVLYEQLYRAQNILAKTGYHHE